MQFKIGLLSIKSARGFWHWGFEMWSWMKSFCIYTGSGLWNEHVIVFFSFESLIDEFKCRLCFCECNKKKHKKSITNVFSVKNRFTNTDCLKYHDQTQTLSVFLFLFYIWCLKEQSLTKILHEKKNVLTCNTTYKEHTM